MILTLILLQSIKSADKLEKCLDSLAYKNIHPRFDPQSIWDYCNEVWINVTKSHKFLSLFQSEDKKISFRRKTMYLKDKFIEKMFSFFDMNENIPNKFLYNYTNDDLSFVDSLTKSTIDMLETSNECVNLQIGTSSIDHYRDILKQIIQ